MKSLKKKKKICRFLLKFTASFPPQFPQLVHRIHRIIYHFSFPSLRNCVFLFLSLCLSFPFLHPLTTYHSLLRVFVFIFFPEFSSDVHASNIPHFRVYVYIYTKPLWNVKNDSISKIANLITNRGRCLNLAHSQRLQRICITITVKSRDPFSFLFFNFFPFPSYFLSSHCLFHLYLTKFRDRRFVVLFFFLLLFLIGHNLQIKIKLATWLFKYI